MLSYIVKRALFMIPVLLVISAAAFVLVRLAPGGPFDGERKHPPAIEANLRAKYRLDLPVYKQYAMYLRDLCRGDLGASTKYSNTTINEIVAQTLPVSMTLGLMAFCFSLGIGIPLGVWAAARQHRLEDYALTLVVLTGISLPSFVIGPILVLVFAFKLGWLPVALWESLPHAVLPCLALSAYFTARVMRLTRESTITTLQQEFITTARAKGLNEFSVLGKHALKLAILPIVSYSGPMLADLLTGSFVVETIFQVPGLGTFLVNGAINRDYTLVVSLTVVYAVLLLSLNLVVDVLYHLLDPRIRLHG
jgi:oligopeptide transport system permease protein